MNIFPLLNSKRRYSQPNEMPMDQEDDPRRLYPRPVMDRENYRENIVPPSQSAAPEFQNPADENAQIPMQDTSTRPRIVPNQSMPLQSQTETDYEAASGVPLSQPNAVGNVVPQMTPVQETQGLIDAIPKDFSIRKDAEGNVIHRGKDRDKKWSLKDKIGSSALGALEGLARGGPLGALLGGLGAGMDRNFLEKREAAQETSRLYPRLQQQQQAEDFQNDQAYKQTQIDYQKQRPEIEANKIKARFDSESQKQLNRLQVLKEKEAAEGKNWKLESRNGKLYKKYSDREEPLVNPVTGEQERDLLNEPIETTSESGQKGYAKFGTVLSTEATKAYRDATLGLQKDRLTETTRSNKASEGLRTSQIKIAQDSLTQRITEYQNEQKKGSTSDPAKLADMKIRLQKARQDILSDDDLTVQEREALLRGLPEIPE